MPNKLFFDLLVIGLSFFFIFYKKSFIFRISECISKLNHLMINYLLTIYQLMQYTLALLIRLVRIYAIILTPIIPLFSTMSNLPKCHIWDDAFFKYACGRSAPNPG